MRKFLALALFTVMVSSPVASSGQYPGAPDVGVDLTDSAALHGTEYWKEAGGLDLLFQDYWRFNSERVNHIINWGAFDRQDVHPEDAPWTDSVPSYMDVGRDETNRMFRVRLSSDAEAVKPFFVVGGGYESRASDSGATVDRFSVPESGREKDPRAKLGIGIGLFEDDRMSMDIEGARVWGLDNPGGDGFFHFTLDMAYHF